MTFPALIESKGVKIRVRSSAHVSAEEDKDLRGGDGWEHTAWVVVLTYQGRQVQTTFNTGMAWEREPPAAAVLYSLILDAKCADSPFEEFCLNLGYDPDSRKALAIYRACRRNAVKLARLLGEELPAFQAAAVDY